MSQTNPLSGGSFQDVLGNPLSNGYLIFELNGDSVLGGTTPVGADYNVRVPLDQSGNVLQPASPQTPYSAIPNDSLTPAGSFFVVTAYTQKGQLAWGPNAQQVLSTPSPFSLSAWVPGTVAF